MPQAENKQVEEVVVCDRSGVIALITLNRPAVLNALSATVVHALKVAFLSLKDEPDIRGVIVTGAGARAFAAGADIAELAGSSASDIEVLEREGQALMDLIEGLGKPVIAAVNGLALGGGCELALACTLRLAAPQAQFGLPEVKLGLLPGFGGTHRLPRLIGRSAGLKMILSGQSIGAEEALRLGLIDEIVAVDGLVARARELLDVIAQNGPIAVRFALEAVNAGFADALHVGLAAESASFAACAATDDKREGTAAFLEKRRPLFTGR